jgi:pSer/pThr/pTyr-binding forkhead associated (FHA) protein
MRLLLGVILSAAIAFAGGPAFAQDPSPAGEEPWGYLYFVRIQKLFPLHGDECTIGRLAESCMVLSSPRVSRRHAVVKRTEAGPELVDVGSSNGTKRNGELVPPRSGVLLQPGDRLEVAEEAALYHETLPELWREEIRHRLLSSIVKLRHALPQDRIRKSLGREELEPAVTEARVDPESGTAALEHSLPLDSESGFPEGSGAFVGSVRTTDEALELSLWTIGAGESMTSRRASFSSLKHATLRISIPGFAAGPDAGPMFPSHLLAAVFDIFPDEPEFSLRFAVSLANQERPRALADAAESLWFRHRLSPGEWKLLVMAAQAKGHWVDREIGEKGLSLAAEDKTQLAAAIEEAKAWLARAKELGAKESSEKEAEEVLVRASERLMRLQGAQ